MPGLGSLTVVPCQMRRFFSALPGQVGSVKKIEKLLVANRGEIACRVMKTAKKLGIKTVAIYSEADADSLHVRMADESYCVGPAPSSQSYLNVSRIIDVIRESGAEAVHPGYGFLSENAQFCKELTRIGVEFVGPSTESIGMMGDKIESKRIAREAGVSIIPGFDGVVSDADMAVKLAKDIGYPVMIKASAGGGGKGMRIAWNDQELRDSFKLASAESKASFGDDRLLIEKFIEQPRHIEIQILGDKHGNIVYLPERECSIQRRNQKVIEEAPSMAIDSETRRRMGEQAVRLARKVGYYSAGTVEFLVDAKRNFYFLEMNTRLQVEHPITEYVTGLDLVEQMISVASGKPLSFRQEDVQLRGWAIEARIYAEDPKLYLPCIGRLERYREPSEGINGAPKGAVRCDSGILEGSEISIYYDPMICKLSTYGSNRTEALERMSDALDAYVIKGVTHNIPLIREVIKNEKFRRGDISTNFLAETFPRGFEGHELSASEQLALVAFAAQAHRILQLKAFSGRPAAGLDVFHVRVGHNLEEKAFVCVQFEKDGRVKIGEGEGLQVATDWDGSDELFSGTLDGQPVTMQVLKRTVLGFDIQHAGTVYATEVLTESEHRLLQYMPKRRVQEDSINAVRAPMPGQIVSVAVKAGETVKMGADLLVIEAMKMQNVLKAVRAGTVKSVSAKVGKSVAADEVLVEFE